MGQKEIVGTLSYLTNDEHEVFFGTCMHCPDSARTQGANERVVLCLMNELVAGNERVL